MSQPTLIELKAALNRATARIEALEAALKNLIDLAVGEGLEDPDIIEACALISQSEPKP